MGNYPHLAKGHTKDCAVGHDGVRHLWTRKGYSGGGHNRLIVWQERVSVCVYKAFFIAYSCPSTDSSVGRAVDCRGIWSSIGRWFESGSVDFFFFFYPICSCLHKGFHDLKVWRDTVADGSADSATPGKLKNEDSEMARLRKVGNMLKCVVLQ